MKNVMIEYERHSCLRFNRTGNSIILQKRERRRSLITKLSIIFVPHLLATFVKEIGFPSLIVGVEINNYSVNATLVLST